MQLKFLLMPLILLMLLLGLFSGLERIGLNIAPLTINPRIHGQIMIILLGFIISMERGAALRNIVWWSAPMLLALAGLLQIIGVDGFSLTLLLIGSLIFLVESLYIVRRHHAPYTYMMALASSLFLLGVLTWIQGSFTSSIPAWIGFLTLTIISERLELSRMAVKPGIQRLLIVIGGLTLLSTLILMVDLSTSPIFGFLLLTSSIWLLRYDVARAGLKTTGFRRFMAINLLTGYCWLATSGAAWILYPFLKHPYMTDIVLHSFFLGFIFHMIIAHAPLIIPSIFGGRIRYNPAFYLPTLLLNISLISRVVGGLLLDTALRQAGGLLNIVAVLLLLPNILYILVGR